MEELRELLRDLFIGATFDGEEVQGIDFTPYNDGAVMLNIRSCTDNWHHMLVPSANIQFVQDRLASVPAASPSSDSRVIISE